MQRLFARLLCAASLATFPVASQAGPVTTQDLVEMVDGFLSAMEQGTATEFYFDNAPPPLIDALAAEHNMSSAQLKNKVSNGEKVNKEYFTLAETTVFGARALSGNAGSWHWSLVPIYTKTRSNTDAVRSTEACSHILAFGNARHMFLAGSLSPREQTTFVSIFPEFAIIPFESTPNCAPDAS